MKSFASDNYAAVHPAVLQAITAANVEHAPSYGADPVTERAIEVLRAEFGSHATVAFVSNGTGANVVGLRLMLRPWEHVIGARTAHIACDECGAPEQLLGAKLKLVDTPDGKLTPELVAAVPEYLGDMHRTQPRVVSISQATEYGTVYSPAEVGALAEAAHSRGLYLHLDGARLANAAASLGVSLAQASSDCGVDVLSFGGTKNGLMGAEAVVVLRPELADALPYARKQLMQLQSKGRFLAAQFLATMDGELWRTTAAHANAMAARLEAGISCLPGVTITQRRQVNVVFATVPPSAVSGLQQAAPFYVWDETSTEVRLMCSWDTTEADVDAFVANAAMVLGAEALGAEVGRSAEAAIPLTSRGQST